MKVRGWVCSALDEETIVSSIPTSSCLFNCMNALVASCFLVTSLLSNFPGHVVEILNLYLMSPMIEFLGNFVFVMQVMHIYVGSFKEFRSQKMLSF